VLHRRSAAVAEGKTTIFKREWRTFDGEMASRRKNFVLTARAFGVRFTGEHSTSARGQSLFPVTALYGIETGLLACFCGTHE
jgi:hypothetical protein